MAPPSVRPPTFGEGDGPDQVQNFLDLAYSASDTIANTDVETTFATSLSYSGVALGDGLRISARGYLSTAGAVALTLRLKLGAGTVTILASSATTISAGITNRGWWIEGFIIPTSVASQVEAQGTLFIAATTNPIRDMVNTGTVGVDGTQGPLILTAEWSAADPGNTITLREFSLERVLAP